MTMASDLEMLILILVAHIGNRTTCNFKPSKLKTLRIGVKGHQWWNPACIGKGLTCCLQCEVSPEWPVTRAVSQRTLQKPSLCPQNTWKSKITLQYPSEGKELVHCFMIRTKINLRFSYLSDSSLHLPGRDFPREAEKCDLPVAGTHPLNPLCKNNSGLLVLWDCPRLP